MMTDDDDLVAEILARHTDNPPPVPTQLIPTDIDADRRALMITRMSDVMPRAVAWLWSGYLPLGKLVLLDGDPSVGKSTLAIAIAAVVSVGGRWPDGTRCSFGGDVLILSAEDALHDTIRPRLDAAAADVHRVHAIAGIPLDDGTLMPPTLANILELESAIRATGARLLIVDVMMAYIPRDTDSHRDQDIRLVLSRLSALAERTDCTVLLLRHLNKTTATNPLYRGGGSIGIVGAARSGLLAAVDPDDPDRRVLAVMKSNLAPVPPSLSYRLVSSGRYGVARVVWGEATDYTARALLESRGDEREIDGWLHDYLEAEGSAKARDVIHDGKLAGYSQDEIKHARRRIKAVSKRQGFGPGSSVIWSIEAIEAGNASKTPMAPMACGQCGAVLDTDESQAAGVCAECRATANTDQPPTHGGQEEGTTP